MNDLILDDLFHLHDGFDSSSNRHAKNYQASQLLQDLDLEDLKANDSYRQNHCMTLINKAISMSTIISVYEKIAFRNYVADRQVIPLFLESLYKVLKECNEETFNHFVYVLSLKKNQGNANPCKWPLITYLLVCFKPYEEVFIKPTTIKKLLLVLESDIKYQSQPNYQTYHDIKELILNYKEHSSICQGLNHFTLSGVIFVALDQRDRL